MKYIRTKDGRIYLINEKKTNDFYCVIDNNEERYVPRDNWLDSAYTIEELCDLIVVDNNSEYFTYYLTGEKGLKTFRQLRDSGVLTENDSVRCYIWIDDKGVKVAETNDKGELKLL